jgi:hypothetical protein
MQVMFSDGYSREAIQQAGQQDTLPVLVWISPKSRAWDEFFSAAVHLNLMPGNGSMAVGTMRQGMAKIHAVI